MKSMKQIGPFLKYGNPLMGMDEISTITQYKMKKKLAFHFIKNNPFTNLIISEF